MTVNTKRNGLYEAGTLTLSLTKKEKPSQMQAHLCAKVFYGESSIETRPWRRRRRDKSRSRVPQRRQRLRGRAETGDQFIMQQRNLRSFVGAPEAAKGSSCVRFPLTGPPAGVRSDNVIKQMECAVGILRRLPGPSVALPRTSPYLPLSLDCLALSSSSPIYRALVVLHARPAGNARRSASRVLSRLRLFFLFESAASPRANVVVKPFYGLRGGQTMRGASVHFI